MCVLVMLSVCVGHVQCVWRSCSVCVLVMFSVCGGHAWSETGPFVVVDSSCVASVFHDGVAMGSLNTGPSGKMLFLYRFASCQC